MNVTQTVAAAAVLLATMQAILTGILPDKPFPRALLIEHLEYKDGLFEQKLVPLANGGISARWSAEINRRTNGVTFQLCAGSGVAPYRGTLDRYTPDQWTDDTCPPLLPGDEAEAIWEWTDEDGHIRSVSGKIIID